ncbi:hypothetical protein SNARM312S_05485 [Streptomyces narbonensis]
MPTAAAEPVRLSTSQSWVMRAIHVPVLETIAPVKNSR